MPRFLFRFCDPLGNPLGEVTASGETFDKAAAAARRQARPLIKRQDYDHCIAAPAERLSAPVMHDLGEAVAYREHAGADPERGRVIGRCRGRPFRYDLILESGRHVRDVAETLVQSVVNGVSQWQSERIEKNRIRLAKNPPPAPAKIPQFWPPRGSTLPAIQFLPKTASGSLRP